MYILEVLGFAYLIGALISIASIIGFFILVIKVMSIDKTLTHIKALLMEQFGYEIKE
jgi:hypothetical protein